MRLIGEIIRTIRILNKEISKLIELIMSTKSKGVITLIPSQVIFYSIDILVKRVSH